MKLYVLMGQRHEQYEGQLAPEALGVADEHTMSDNPEYMESRVKRMGECNEFVDLQIIKIDIGSDGWEEIKNRLSGNAPAIPGSVVE